jgi:hypothetical protein
MSKRELDEIGSPTQEPMGRTCRGLDRPDEAVTANGGLTPPPA